MDSSNNRSLEAHLASLDDRLYTTVPLSKGYRAIVDRIYYSAISEFSWFAVIGRSGIVYAKTTQIVKGKQVPLQNLVWGLSTKGHFDPSISLLTFENKVTLDCRLRNIKPTGGRQELMRFRSKRPSNSEYKGVRKGQNGRFGAHIFDGQSSISLGRFDTEREAAIAYDSAARLLFGENALLNIPEVAPTLEQTERAALYIHRSRSKQRKKGAPI